MNIADLHCDLLLYLEKDPVRTPYDRRARCSFPQMQEGKVQLQVCALFAMTEPSSTLSGMSQAKIFKDLSQKCPQSLRLLPAIENASIFCDEEEPLDTGLKRLNDMIHLIGNPLYISLTWNTENRFGGGAHTSLGLKEEGKRLLEFLSGKGIAIDLSHTSDLLAKEIFNFIDKKNLRLPVLASHSNFRTCHNVPRNLPDALALEIKNRNGLIGLNFIRGFLGDDISSALIEQLEHAMKLGLQDNLCFGSDFFFTEDLPEAMRAKMEPYFLPEFGDSSTAFHRTLELWKTHLKISQDLLQNVAFKNVDLFLNRQF